jgi:signal transduction histidine kinase
MLPTGRGRQWGLAKSGRQPKLGRVSKESLQAQENTRALTALLRISALATRTDDPAAALREILATCLATFAADAGSLSLFNPDRGLLEVAVQHGIPSGSSYHHLKPGHGITGRVVVNRRPALIPDVTVEPRYIAVRPTARCEMAVPLLDGETLIGVIDLESDRTAGFSPSDLNLFATLANEAARVLPRLWQVDRLKAKARQLESLVNTGQTLVTKLERQELFDTLTREARHMLAARACALYQHEAEHGSVRLASFAGEAAWTPPDGKLPLASCLVGTAIQKRRQMSYADVSASPDYAELVDLPPDPGLKSALVSPLLADREVLGVLVVFTGEVRRFDNDEKRLCATLAGLGAVAYQNARLYARIFQSEDTLRKNERLTTLGLLAAEIAHEIRNPLTVLNLLHGGLDLAFAPEDPRATDMRVIREKLDQLEAIVSRVLSFAKAPSALHSRWSLVDIVADTLVLVRHKLAQGRVAVHFTPPTGHWFVEVQKGQIQQVLLNLLINSTQAMPDGGAITLSLSTEPRLGGAVVHADISDTGTGVPEAIRGQIFDSFLSGRPDGTGLGLAIAKRILLSHHGDICLLASSPAGTTMRMTLPLAR